MPDQRSAGDEPMRAAMPAVMLQQRQTVERLAGTRDTPMSNAALAHWQHQVSVPSLASPFLVFVQCLAYAAPVWARLRRRPIAWCFHGTESSGRSVLPDLAACVYGGGRDMATWQGLGRNLPDALADQPEGLIAIGEATPADHLAQTTIAARMWHDHEPDPALAHRRDAISVFDSDARFNPYLARARFGDGKLWVFNVLADAGAGHGIYVERPDDGGAAGAAGAAALLLNRAQKAPAEAGLRWLRFVNWWPDDRLAELFQDEAAAVLDSAPLDAGTGISSADLGRCFNFASTAGEWATMQGLTGWPAGAAYDASRQVLTAWGASAMGS